MCTAPVQPFPPGDTGAVPQLAELAFSDTGFAVSMDAQQCLEREFMQENTTLLHMEHITKHFAGSVALSDAYIHVARGEVHALIGQNGAGKSTLIKVLTGVYRCDEGTILFDGRTGAFPSPQQAQRDGISTIYQEINLVPFRSITENIFLGREI